MNQNAFLGIVSAFLLGTSAFLTSTSTKEVSVPPQLAAPTGPQYTPILYTPLPPPPPLPAELVDVQVPIPHDCRVFNRTGSQCVYCTAETLGNFHKVKGTQGLTNQYKGTAGPGDLNAALTRRNVKFKQIFHQHNLHDFIEEWVTNKKLGVGIDVYGRHVITCVHFERNKCVKIIDNCDKSLSVRTWTWNEFLSKGTMWAFVVFPDDYDVKVGLEENAIDVQWPCPIK